MKLAAMLVLAGCGPWASAVIDDTTHQTDADCVAALAHVVQCDARFGDRRVLCSRGGSSCGPYINVEQSVCLAAQRCEQVRDAIDRADWLCGVKTR
jgi:hypothetical protein